MMSDCSRNLWLKIWEWEVFSFTRVFHNGLDKFAPVHFVSCVDAVQHPAVQQTYVYFVQNFFPVSAVEALCCSVTTNWKGLNIYKEYFVGFKML